MHAHHIGCAGLLQGWQQRIELAQLVAAQDWVQQVILDDLKLPKGPLHRPDLRVVYVSVSECGGWVQAILLVATSHCRAFVAGVASNHVRMR